MEVPSENGICAAPYENVPSGKSGQRRPRLACAFAQSDQCIRSSQTQSVDTIEYFNRGQMHVE